MVELYLLEFAGYLTAAIIVGFVFGYAVACLMAASGTSARVDLLEEGIFVRDVEIRELKDKLEEK